MVYVEYYLLAILTLIAFYTDAKSQKLPNWLSVSGVMIGIGFHLITSGMDGLIFSVLGLVIGFAALMLLYLFKAVGAGDVKIFGAIGALVGTEFVLYAAMYSIIYAGLIGVLILLFRKEFMQRMLKVFFKVLEFRITKDPKTIEEYKKRESLRFPFMYAVLPGIITTMYYFFS